MAIDWMSLASSLLSSNNPVSAVAGAIKSTADVVHDFTKDDPVKQAKADKAVADALENHLNEMKGATNAEELNQAITDFRSDNG
jgi:hypothetical protein